MKTIAIILIIQIFLNCQYSVSQVISCNLSDKDTTKSIPIHQLETKRKLLINAIENGATSSGVYIHLADVYYMLGNYVAACKNYKVAIEKCNRDCSPLYVKSAAAWTKFGDYLKAIEDYEMVLSSRNINNKPQIYSSLGELYYHIGDYKKSIGYYRSALNAFNKSDYTSSCLIYNIGMNLMQQEKYSKAIDEFDILLTSIGPDYNSYMQKGVCNFKLNNYEKAKSNFDYCIKTDAKIPEAYLKRSEVKRITGDSIGAKMDYKTYIKLTMEKGKLPLLSIPDEINNVWFVCVGINIYQYNNILKPLNTPTENIGKFFRFIETVSPYGEGGGFKIINENATSKNIKYKTDSLFCDNSKVSHNDLIIFYFSGHGLAPDMQAPGFCPYEYQTPEQLVEDDDIVSIMKKSPAKYKLCVLEACKNDPLVKKINGTHGGSNTSDSNDPPIPEETFSRLNEIRKNIDGEVAYITSSKIGEQSYIFRDIGSVFSHYLYKGIKNVEADLNGNHVITVNELFNYVSKNVTKYVSKEKLEQTPQINIKGYENDFPIVEYTFDY